LFAGAALRGKQEEGNDENLEESRGVLQPEDEDGDTAGMLSKVAYNLEMDDVVIAWTTFAINPSVLEVYTATAGIAAEGDIASLSYRFSGNMPGYEDFNSQYTAEGFPNFGDEAQEWGAFAYDAAQIIIAAIDRADSANPSEIRDQIAATMNYRGVVGTYEGFDSQGDVIPQWAWLQRYQDGEWKVIWSGKIFLPIMLNNFGP